MLCTAQAFLLLSMGLLSSLNACLAAPVVHSNARRPVANQGALSKYERGCDSHFFGRTT